MKNETNGEPRLVGWKAIADHLTKTGRTTSIYWLQRYGRRSVGRFDAGLLGFHGPYPVTVPSLADAAWDEMVKPVADVRRHQSANQESKNEIAAPG
jgi:hypothetical protein